MTVLIEAALNGSRSRDEHHAIPRTPFELAESARGAVAAGAQVLHLHVFDEDGAETFAAGPTCKTLRAVRAACPGVPISLTTSEGIEPDPARRLDYLSRWVDFPDLVTANMGEAGIGDVCDYLIERGVRLEAGILSLADANNLIRLGDARKFVRVLIEPLDANPDEAERNAALMEERVTAAGISVPQVHHGDGIASWAVNRRALNRGHGIRTGLEDTTVLPDGRPAADNADLVRAAVEMAS